MMKQDNTPTEHTVPPTTPSSAAPGLYWVHGLLGTGEPLRWGLCSVPDSADCSGMCCLIVLSVLLHSIKG